MKIFAVYVFSSLLCLATAVFGQTSKGTIAGTVTDASGAIIGDASITVLEQQSGSTRSFKSGADGAFRLEALEPGVYRITASAPGFATSRLENVRVSASVVTSVPVQLEIGSVGTSVEVLDSAAHVETESGSISGTLSSAEILQLPINSLNPVALALNLPGVTDPGGRGFSNGVNFSVNGLRPRANNFLIDGFDNNDQAIAGQALQPQNPEAIQEVAVLTNSYPAEFGRGGGSVTNVIYKSGTNQYHGSLYDRYRGAALNAITSEQHQQGFTTVPNFVENIWGFTGGGPILKNKLFLFGEAQWDHQNFDQQGASLLIPTASGVAALQSIAPNANRDILLSSLGGLTAPEGSSSINTINIGNRPGCGSPCLVEVGDLIRTPKGLSRSYEYIVRGDYRPSESNSFEARYIGTQGSLTPDLFANAGALATQDTFQGGPARNLGVFWTHVFNAHVVNEARFTAQTIDFTFGLLGSTASSPLANTPNLTIQGLGASYGGVSATFPQGRGHDTYQYQEALSFIIGSHSFKVGADLAHLAVTDSIPFNSRGTIGYLSGGDCSAIGLTRCTGLANFLDNFTGPAGTAGRQFGSPILTFAQTQQNYYFQDTWKLRSNLTLNYGLRYEYQGTPFNGLPYPAVNDGTAPFDPYPLRVKEKPYRTNFGPRFGFAYTPDFLKSVFGDRKTVIRGGFGAFNDAFFTNIEDNVASSAPNTLGGTLVAPRTGRGTLGASGLVPSVTPSLNPLASVSAIVASLRNPLTYQWNVNVQRELPLGMVATVAYVGTRGEHLLTNIELNPGVNGTRLNPNRGSIGTRTNFADSIYHGLQVGVNRSFSHGLQVRGSYTFSKSIDNSSEVFATSGVSSYPQDPFNISGERGPSAYDHKHRGVITWVYDLPHFNFTTGVGSVATYVTKGWNLAGSVAMQSGAPQTITASVDSAGTLRANGRPDLSNPKAAINYSEGCISDPACITGVGQENDDGSLTDWNTGAPGTRDQFRYIVPDGRFGNVGRNTIYSPGTVDWTLGLSREFPIPRWEGHRVEFRAEAYNPFNHANAGILSGDINDPAFLNKDLTYAGGRELRLWLYYRF